MTGAGLCETCLAPLTTDDIGGECTTCWQEWRAVQEQRNDEWWEGSNDA